MCPPSPVPVQSPSPALAAPWSPLASRVLPVHTSLSHCHWLTIKFFHELLSCSRVVLHCSVGVLLEGPQGISRKELEETAGAWTRSIAQLSLGLSGAQGHQCISVALTSLTQRGSSTPCLWPQSPFSAQLWTVSPCPELEEVSSSAADEPVTRSEL